LEKQISILRCEEHDKEVVLFCQSHHKFLCVECFLEHKDHVDNCINSTEAFIDSLLVKVHQILKGQKDLLNTILLEIEGMRKLPKIDIDHLMRFAHKLKVLEKELLFGDKKLELTQLLLKLPKQSDVEPQERIAQIPEQPA
jgi:hypothetical protein